MQTIKDEYLKILKMTQNLISEEIKNERDQSPPKWIVSDFKTYNYFKTLALQNKQHGACQNEKSAPVPVQKISPTYIPPPVVPLESKVPVELKVISAPKETEVKSLLDPVKPNTKQPLELHPMGIAPLQDLSDIRKIVEKVLPNEVILDHIPTSNPKVLIISVQSNPFEEALLLNFARAIDICIAPAKLVSSKKYKATDFPNLKMVILTGEMELPSLVRVLKINLPELLKEPKAKQKLWEETKHVFYS